MSSTKTRVKASPTTMRRVLAWQEAGFVQPLTCGNDKCRAHLLPSVAPGGWLCLQCPDCELAQNYVPEVVLSADLAKYGNMMGATPIVAVAGQFRIHDKVERAHGSDYRFPGIIIGKFPKLSGEIRYAVEDDRGVIFIQSDKSLRAATVETSKP